MHPGDTLPAALSVRLDGRRIKRLRRERGWTQDAMATRIRKIAAGLSDDHPYAEGRTMCLFTISRAERGLAVSRVTAALIAMALEEKNPAVFYAAA